ncbi:proteasome regulatory particle subunit [Vanrija albida]|uniref:Proteasome regulatory particle subunit n=1 Tax=Vanrija albida TaxID=181172 RepID=A0ABR3Q5P0_9TREE
MADDSVPLPFPNLKVPQWHYQIVNVDRLRDEATTAFWAAVEADGACQSLSLLLTAEMAPYIRSTGLKPPNAQLLAELEKKNTAELESIDTKLKDAEENLGESEISELLRQKAMYLCRIGHKELAIPALDTALEKTTGLGARIDLVLATIRMGFFSSDAQLVISNIARAADLIDSGGDWDRRNRLKVYRALHLLSIRDFKQAADLLNDSLSTFTATELMEYEEFVALAVLASALGCDRKNLKAKILSSSEVNGCISTIPSLAALTDSLYKSSYAAFFVALAEVEQQYLIPNPILAPHARYYVREMRIKAYQQLLESYRSLTLERMSRSFGVSEAFMDRDLSRFIANGRLSCTIDKVSGVITTDKLSSHTKTAIYEQFLKQGDLLLSDMHKLHRVLPDTTEEFSRAVDNPPRVVCLRQSPTCIHFTAIHPTAEAAAADRDSGLTRQWLDDYFQLGAYPDLVGLYDDWRGRDPAFFGKVDLGDRAVGIRVLRQDPWECLLAFITSTNNHIPRITSLLHKLSARFSPTLLALEDPDGSGNETVYRLFPKPHELPQDGLEAQLRELGFGYRAPFIVSTLATLRAANEDVAAELEAWRKLPEGDARAELIRLKGPSLIPVDTHIYGIAARHPLFPARLRKKTMSASLYEDIQTFLAEKWGPLGGWCQAVVFAADLRESTTQRPTPSTDKSPTPVKKPKRERLDTPTAKQPKRRDRGKENSGASEQKWG